MQSVQKQLDEYYNQMVIMLPKTAKKMLKRKKHTTRNEYILIGNDVNIDSCTTLPKRTKAPGIGHTNGENDVLVLDSQSERHATEGWWQTIKKCVY